MNPYSLTGLGSTEHTGQIPDMSSLVSLVAGQSQGSGASVASGAGAGAAAGTATFPIIGTAIGAVVGAIAGWVKFLKSEADFRISSLDIGGLKYIKVTPTNKQIPIMLFLAQGMPVQQSKWPTISKNQAKAINIARELNYGMTMTTKLRNASGNMLAVEFPAYVSDALRAKNLSFNDVNRIVVELPNGDKFSALGNQVVSTIKPGTQPAAAPVVSQAGLGWVAGLLGLSVIGGLLWKASQKKKTA
jgi:hypothetical protein